MEKTDYSTQGYDQYSDFCETSHNELDRKKAGAWPSKESLASTAANLKSKDCAYGSGDAYEPQPPCLL